MIRSNENTVVYICSPYSGKTKEERKQNIKNAKYYGLYALRSGYAPIITHLSIAEILNDDIAEERALGLEADLKLIRVCSELWVFGTYVSDGMRVEIKEAYRLGIKIRWFDKSCSEYIGAITETFIHNILNDKQPV